MNLSKPTVALLLLAPICASRVLASLDENQNGMSDLWEAAFNQGRAFNTQSTDHDPAADPDADGWTNHEESIAGTDPFVADSLRLSSRCTPGDDGGAPVRSICWPSVEGKIYQLAVTSNLVGWHDHGPPLLGTGDLLELELPQMNGEAGLFARVQVRDEDPDGDELSSWEEIRLGTNRMLADSDDDGTPDGVELAEKTDPMGHSAVTDSDGDGVLDIDDALPGDPMIAWPKADSLQYILIDLGDEVSGWTPVGLADDYTVLFAEGTWKRGEATAHDFLVTEGTVVAWDGETLSHEPYRVEGGRAFDMTANGDVFLVDARAWATDGRWLDESVNWNTVSVFGPGLETAWDTSNGHSFEPGSSAAFWPVGVSGTEVFSIRKDPTGGVDPPPVLEAFPLAGGVPSVRANPWNYQPVASADPLHSDATESGWLACNLKRISSGEGGLEWRLGVWNPEGEFMNLPEPNDGWKWPVHLTEFSNGKVALTAGNQDHIGEVFMQGAGGGFEVSEHFAGEDVRMLGGNGTALAADNRLWVNGEWLEPERWCPKYGDMFHPGWYSRVIDSNEGGGYLVKAFNAEQTSESVKLLVPAGIVPDYNRDGKIDLGDRGQVTRENPWRWWINDDNDLIIEEILDEGSDVPGQDNTNPGWGLPMIPDHYDSKIDGLRDLVDFFPIHFDLRAALEVLPKEDFKYIVKHEDEALKYHEIVETKLEKDHNHQGPSSYLRNLARAQSLARAYLVHTNPAGVELSFSIMGAIENGESTIICEAVKLTDKPLILEVRKNDGTVLGELEFPLKFCEIENMYRHGNMRDQVPGGSGGLRTQLQDPGEPYPDELTSESYFVFVHGFNVDGEAARGWHAEIFKRLHQLGNRARFIGISWHGDVSPDYHEAVKHAFRTSENLAAWLQVGEAKITIAAHSLGNVLVSNAIEHEELDVDRYYMINAASPIEAYDPAQMTGSDGTEMAPRMTERFWKSYDEKLYASNWYNLFDEGDERRKLTWRSRFSEKVPGLAFNFYSTGEDVVENAGPDENFVSNTLFHGFVRHAWVQQEISKGHPTAQLALRDTHAGWAFNTSRDAFDVPEGYWKPLIGAGIQTRRPFSPEEARVLTEEDIQAKPFCEPFKFQDLYDPSRASGEAGKSGVQQELLAAAVPAMTYAVAANEVLSLNPPQGLNRNFNMMVLKNENGDWPRQSGDWVHSDFRDVAFSYVHYMYQKMIEEGGLAQ